MRDDMGQHHNHTHNHNKGVVDFFGEDVIAEERPRLVIHIPSVTVAEYIRLSIDGLAAIQNSLISCLYQLADRNLHMVYILPFNLSKAEFVYYDRFLSILNVPAEPKRLHFIVPELVQRLPPHMPLAQMLWHSSKALNKIKLISKRFGNSFIIPSSIGWAEKRIANFLNIPMISPDPTVASTLSTRSFAKKIFMESSVNIPVGAHDIGSEDDFLMALARLITCNIDVRRWKFRFNADFNGESVVFLDTSRFDIVAALRGEMDIMAVKNNSAAWFSRPIQLAARKRVMIQLKTDLAAKVQICRKDIYPCWEVYMSMVKTHTIVIEAEALQPKGYIDAMCFIDPLGSIQMAASVEVVFDNRYASQAFVYPQALIPQPAIDGAMTSIGNVLFANYDAIGYVTVRFAAFFDAYDNIPRVWASDIYFGITSTFGSLGTMSVACDPVVKLPKSLIPTIPPGFTASLSNKIIDCCLSLILVLLFLRSLFRSYPHSRLRTTQILSR